MKRYTILVGMLTVAVLPLSLWGQQIDDPRSRYKVSLDLRKYPQTSYEKAFASVVQAVNEGNFDYLMAQLADPAFVDERVAEYKKAITGPDAARDLVAFDRLSKEVKEHFRRDPSLAQELRELLKRGKWRPSENSAFIYLEGIELRGATFRNIDGRWYMLNPQHAMKDSNEKK